MFPRWGWIVCLNAINKSAEKNKRENHNNGSCRTFKRIKTKEKRVNGLRHRCDGLESLARARWILFRSDFFFKLRNHPPRRPAWYLFFGWRDFPLLNATDCGKMSVTLKNQGKRQKKRTGVEGEWKRKRPSGAVPLSVSIPSTRNGCLYLYFVFAET